MDPAVLKMIENLEKSTGKNLKHWTSLVQNQDWKNMVRMHF